MTVRKRLQRIGNSHGLVLDRDLLAALAPDGDLDATLLVEVVGTALVIRRENSTAPTAAQVASGATVSPPTLPSNLSPTERLILQSLTTNSPATRGEIATVIGRSPETVSAALKRLKGDEWVVQTGRDWRLSTAARRRLETNEGRRFAGLPPSLARLAVALEAGPLTAGEVAESLGVPRRTANALLKRAFAEELATASEEATPRYDLS